MPEPKLGDVMFYGGTYVLFNRIYSFNPQLFWGTVLWDDWSQKTLGTYSLWSLEKFTVRKVTITIQDADIDIEAAFQKEIGNGE